MGRRRSYGGKGSERRIQLKNARSVKVKPVFDLLMSENDVSD
jgi:hypothetical protein